MIKINNQELKNFGKPFVVAEAGINHNGELNKAFEMIEVAKIAGVDAIKFQTFRAEEFCGDKTQMFTYQSQGQEVFKSKKNVMMKIFCFFQHHKIALI